MDTSQRNNTSTEFGMVDEDGHIIDPLGIAPFSRDIQQTEELPVVQRLPLAFKGSYGHGLFDVKEEYQPLRP